MAKVEIADKQVDPDRRAEPDAARGQECLPEAA
jgi:hypothetical protein